MSLVVQLSEGRIKIVSPNVFPLSATRGKAGGKKSKMSSRTTVEYPNIPSILALIGGALIILFDIFLLTISIVILPHLNYTNFTTPRGYTGSLGIHPRPNPNPHRITLGSSLSASHERIPSHLSISGIVFLTSISLHSASQHGWGHLFPGTT